MDLLKIPVCTGCLCIVFLTFFLAAAFAADGDDNIILTAEEIQDMQALKIADVLNNVPGVRAGDSSVSIHGSYKVKVFVDGQPINDPASSHGGVNWDLVSFFCNKGLAPICSRT